MRIPKPLVRVLRISVGVGISVGLIHVTLKTTGGDFWSELLAARKPHLLLSLLLSGGVLGIQTYRWNLLLRVQGIYMRARDLFRLQLMGLFFNLALPGAVSGDLVKTVFIVRQVRGKKVEAAFSVLLDRVLGLFGLFPLASLMVLLYMPLLLDLELKYRPIQVAAFAVGLGSVAAILVIAIIELRSAFMGWQLIAWVVDWGKGKLPASIVSGLKRLIEALELYRRTRGAIAAAFGLSIVVHSCLAFSLFFVGASVGEDVLRLGDYFLTTQVSNAVAAIPLTPAGIGTRDAVIAMLFTALKAPPAKAGVVPVIMTIIILFWGLVGGIVFVVSKVPKVETRLSDVFSREELSDLSPEKLEAN